MSMARDGVSLGVEGASGFVNDLKKSENAYKDLISGFAKGAAEAGGLNSSLAALGSGVLAIGGALGAAAVQIGQAFVGALVDAGKAMVDLAISAAPLEGLETQFRTISETFESGAQGMLSALQGASSGMIATRDLMKSFNDAAALVSTQFAERLPEGLELLGKVSAATGEDMNFLLDSLVKGVGRVSPAILDNLKIQVSVAEATAAATEMFGKQADQLTKVEQQAALTEVTYAKLEEKFGALPDIGQSASAQMARLQASFQNIRDTLGSALLPAFTTVVAGVNRLVSAFSDAIAEGGSLFPIITQIGAALSIAADAFFEFADFVANALDSITQDTSMTIADTIAGALRWGVELVAAFAEGIVQAASSVLVQAMNFISNMLTSWLAPGSPPKVAPGLKDWGIAAMGEFLGGMTEADFAILEEVQKPLQKILEGPAFADLSKGLAESLAGGDRGGFLKQLTESSEIFGAEIAQLADLNFQLADSVSMVENAEQALAQSRENLTKAQADINTETLKYNQLLRDGASPAILNAQMAQIEAAEESLRVSQEQAKAQQEVIDQGQSRIAELTEEEQLQSNLVDQLLQVNDALNQQERAQAGAGAARAGGGGRRAAAGRGGGGGAIAEMAMPALSGLAGGLATGIGTAIEGVKAQMQAAFADIFAPLQEAWANIKEDIFDLGRVWDAFAATVGSAWDKLKEQFPFLQEVETFVTGLPEQLLILGDAFMSFLGNALEPTWDFIKTNLLPIFISLKKLGIVIVEKALELLASLFLNPFLTTIQTVWTFIKEELIPLFEGPLTTAFEFFRENILDRITEGFEGLRTILGRVRDFIDDLVNAISNLDVSALNPFMGRSPSPLEIGFRGISEAMQEMSRVRLPELNRALQPLQAGAMGTSPLQRAPNSIVMNNNFGGNNISGGMDAAAFDAMVSRSVRRQLGGI